MCIGSGLPFHCAPQCFAKRSTRETLYFNICFFFHPLDCMAYSCPIVFLFSISPIPSYNMRFLSWLLCFLLICACRPRATNVLSLTCSYRCLSVPFRAGAFLVCELSLRDMPRIFRNDHIQMPAFITPSVALPECEADVSSASHCRKTYFMSVSGEFW